MVYDDSFIGTYPAPPGDKKEATPEKVPIDGRVSVSYDVDGLIANMVMFAPQNGGRPVTMELVLKELKDNGIVVGIDDYDIKYIIDEQIYETPVCVARAIPAKRGKNGSVSFRYEKERKIKPKHDEYGMVDYHELNSITLIRKGDVIADITLPTEGEPGMNIFGKEIPAEPGIPAKVTVGKNTLMTADGKTIVAACDGHIVYGTGCFIVEDKVVIRSDLDLSVGNITFFGDVHVKGNVMEGFSIHAGKNLKIDGSVFGGEITVGGNLTIVGGAINSTINCEGNATIGFCENTTMIVHGNIESKQFAFCDVFCYGGVTAKGINGVIVGGKMTSMRDINAGIIGSSKYTATEINIGDGSVTFARKREAEADLAASIEAYDNAIRNIDFLNSRKKRQGGHLTDAQQKQMKIETQNKLFHAMRKKELSKLIAELEEDIKNKDQLRCRCNNLIYPGSHFCVNFLTLDITQVYHRSTVTIVGDTLTVIPN